MITETFIEDETKDLVFEEDKLEEWQKKVDELGLEGQKKLTEKSDTPNPFRFMNKGMVNIFKTVCPVVESVEKYSKTPIPLEIMGVIYLAQKDSYFDEIQVWYDDIDPDPILVGKKGDDKYLMARWGAERLDMDVLKNKAMARWIEGKTAAIKTKIAELSNGLNNIESHAIKHIQGDYTPLDYL